MANNGALNQDNQIRYVKNDYSEASSKSFAREYTEEPKKKVSSSWTTT